MQKILLVLAVFAISGLAFADDDDTPTSASACSSTSSNPYAKMDATLKEKFTDVAVPEELSDSDRTATNAINECKKGVALRYHKAVAQLKIIDTDKNARLCSLSSSINPNDSSQVNKDHLEQLQTIANGFYNRYSGFQATLNDLTTDKDALDSMNLYCDSRCSTRDGYGKRDVASNAKYAPILKEMSHPCYQIFGELRAYAAAQATSTEMMSDGALETISQLNSMSASNVAAPVSTTLAAPSDDSANTAATSTSASAPAATAATSAVAPATANGASGITAKSSGLSNSTLLIGGATAAGAAAIAIGVGSSSKNSSTPVTPATVKIDSLQNMSTGTSSATSSSTTPSTTNIFKSNSSTTSVLCQQNPNLMGCQKSN